MHDIVAFYRDLASDAAQSSTPFQQAGLRQLLQRYASSLPKGGVLDLGSGRGANLPTLELYFSTIVAVDISERALSFSKSQDLTPKRYHIQADTSYLPLQDQSFDVVVCTEVLEHLPDPFLAVGEAYRVLKSGGYFLVSSPNYKNLVGYLKRRNDRMLGRESWEPWGAHKGGFERHMTPEFTERLLAQFNVVDRRGAGYILAWLYGTPLARLHSRFPLLWLGKLPVLKALGMHYYVLAQKI